MRQLTSLDAQFLALESDRQVGHVGGLSIYDPSTAPGGTMTGADIRALMVERLPLLPPMRWRLAEVPLNLDYPYWVDDSGFDLDYHVREIALPAPGSDEQLAEQVARIYSRPLDRSRPLWELYVIQGLPEGRVAMLTKIHHAVIDGMSGAEIMGILLDVSPEGRDLGEARMDAGDPSPGGVEMLARGIVGTARWPLRLARSLPRALPNAEEAPAIFGAIPGAQDVGRLAGAVARRAGLAPPKPDGPRLAAPRTSFNGRISRHRRFAFGSVPLDDVKDAKNAYGVTVNDVVVSVCAGAVRRWLTEHGELPDTPLVAQVPVSVRGADQIGTYGNRILLMSAPLFTDEADPVERLMRTHDALSEMKERHRALPAELLQDANHFIPPALFSRAARLTFRLSTGLRRPPWNLVISNVPGPQLPLFCAGAKLLANYPVSVITDGMGLNLTVMSYMGHMDFGLVADREQMPDVWKLMGWIDEELDLLCPGRRGRDREAPAERQGRREGDPRAEVAQIR